MHPPASEESVSQTRDVTINIRAQPNQRDLIDRRPITGKEPIGVHA